MVKRLFEGSFQSIRRFQSEVNEVKAGMECGIRVDGFHDYRKEISLNLTL